MVSFVYFLSDHADVSVDVSFQSQDLVFLASALGFVLQATNAIASDLPGSTRFSSLYGWH